MGFVTSPTRSHPADTFVDPGLQPPVRAQDRKPCCRILLPYCEIGECHRHHTHPPVFNASSVLRVSFSLLFQVQKAVRRSIIQKLAVAPNAYGATQRSIGRQRASAAAYFISSNSSSRQVLSNYGSGAFLFGCHLIRALWP
jgi:hypothetical protein